MSGNKKIGGKKIPDAGTNAQQESDDDDTASILFASNTGASTNLMSNVVEGLAIVGEESSNGQFKTNSKQKSNLPCTKTSNVVSEQTPNLNSAKISELPDIPWPDGPCSVRELYKGYIDQSDPFLKPPQKMPAMELPKTDPTLPKLHKRSGGLSQNFSKWKAEMKKEEEKKAKEKDTEMKDKDDSEGGNDDSQKDHKTK